MHPSELRARVAFFAGVLTVPWRQGFYYRRTKRRQDG